jgi:hypothetical protein
MALNFGLFVDLDVNVDEVAAAQAEQLEQVKHCPLIISTALTA